MKRNLLEILGSLSLGALALSGCQSNETVGGSPRGKSVNAQGENKCPSGQAKCSGGENQCPHGDGGGDAKCAGGGESSCPSGGESKCPGGEKR